MPLLERHRLTGVCPPACGAVAASLVRTRTAPVWLAIAEDAEAAEQLAEDVVFFLSVAGARASPAPVEVLLFPEAAPDSRDMREAFTASSDRLAVLSRLRAMNSVQVSSPSNRNPAAQPSEDPPLLIVSTPAALLQTVPATEAFAARELTLSAGMKQPFQALLAQLQALDYDCEAVCEAPGHYAVRGGIVDVYPVTATQPYRIDFFGDDIEEIRTFDPATQRSGDKAASIKIPASPRLSLAPARAGLADYLPPGTHLMLIEPAAVERMFRDAASETPEAPDLAPNLGSTGALPVPPGAHGRDARAPLLPLLAKCSVLFGIGDLDEAAELFSGVDLAESTLDSDSLSHHRRFPDDSLLAPERLAAEESARRDFLRRLAEWHRAGQAILFVAAKEGDEKRLGEILADDPHAKAVPARICRGTLNEGFRISAPRAEPEAGTARSSIPAALLGLLTALVPAGSTGLVVVTETEILGRRRPRRPSFRARAHAQRAQIDQLLDFSELVEGDFVVHLQHGIALFRGLKTLDTAKGPQEVISLEFDDAVTLHVPLSESHLVSRYVGLGRTRPKLGKIGSGRWEKVRGAAERATLDFAAELLAIQAKRDSKPGDACPPDTEWQKEFEGSFPFSETPDQLLAIRDTKADMERERPMDRLVCGDVGFGKTEVAIRAAFKAVQGGGQAAVLVPTTVLAQQHLGTFRERMAGYPVAIEMLSRFRSRSEQQRVLADAAAGRVDILIGTHRLLQRDVAFRELRLVVVDEEQRFGVRHKEAFKRLRETVDVLSLSATPIPRTLYLALTGARDLSVIETPPANRHPIQTIVRTYDERIVVEAIRREIRRGGQVFYLHNRVATIGRVADGLRSLLPEVRIGVGHGKMGSEELEREMTDFVAGVHQVLVCTTIIESGLDIPNCNTIIIEGADRFGLAQLYQLRGRVGRFRHQAYAYLLLHRHAQVLDAARRRLAALRQHTQPGAGFRIAMRDLELRGAGNLLGAEQSGHIAGVGFELYCQLLRQSIARLKGDKAAAAVRASVKLDFILAGEPRTTSDGSPRQASQEAGRRADGYTALKDAESAAAPPVETIAARLPASYIAETRLRIDIYRRLALSGSVSELRQIEAELRDRFGKFGREVRALLLSTEIRLLAEQKGLISVETESNRLKCLRNSGSRDDWVQVGGRFPRLTAPGALLRLKEIIVFLNRLPNP